jgi:pilus assembly protein CpaB
VLAIDQTIEEQNGKMVVVGNVATLELRPEQAEVLSLAEQLGDISLALRSILDAHEHDGAAMSSTTIGGQRAGTVNVVRFGVTSRVNASN